MAPKRQTAVRAPGFRRWLLKNYADSSLFATDVIEAAISVGSFAASLDVEDLVPNDRSVPSGGNSRAMIDRATCMTDVDGNIFWSKLPLHDRRLNRRKMKPHPFLMPHRQGSESFESCLLTDTDMANLPVVWEFEEVREEGPFQVALCRMYTDGIDVGDESTRNNKNSSGGNPKICL